MNYTDEQLYNLHNVEKEILTEVITLCEENNLAYFVDWGTLLGTVRHQGFIPWDDDVDISMPRNDYNTFLEIATKKLRPGYVLQHFSTDPLTPQYCAKVRKDGTKFVEEYAINLPIHQGVFIDIYPIDNLPNDTKISRKYQRKATILKQLFIAKVVRQPSYHKKAIKKILLSCVRKVIAFIIVGIPRQYIFRQLDRHLQQYNSIQCEKVSCIGTSRGEHFREDIYPLETSRFEDLIVRVPHNQKQILEDEYGDFLILPPKEERFGHCPALFQV